MAPCDGKTAKIGQIWLSVGIRFSAWIKLLGPGSPIFRPVLGKIKPVLDS